METSEVKALLKIARETVELWTRKKKKLIPKNFPESFREKRGVFVSIHTKDTNELRGCIGYPEPVYPLIGALVESAISACMDPRFEPVKPEELKNLKIEVSVLTKPGIVSVGNPKDYPKKIKIGKDGLIIERGFQKGLLLPQVAEEWGWDAKEFLSHTCMKAGIEPNAWLGKDVKVCKFRAEIFSE